MSRICLYFKHDPERDRWIRGDRFVRPIIRRIVRGKPPVSGVDKVFTNLRLGLDRLSIPYEFNLPFSQLRDDDKVGVMGRAHCVLDEYHRPNQIVGGPYLMTHPSEWPTLCEQFPVARYLQHCDWANDIYKPYFGERCKVWSHGVDTASWAPAKTKKDIDVLIYDKVRWNRHHFEPHLIQPIRDTLDRHGLKTAEIRYGFYSESDYRALLARSRSMIFLVEHESQGSACQECLSSDVPMLAWEQGHYLDPNLAKWGQKDTPASSVPYFDERCGMTFRGIEDFPEKFDRFLAVLNSGDFASREFVIENLTLEACARRYLEILDEVAGGSGS
jgi:hypothetical protein